MILDEALASLRAMCEAYCEDSSVQTAGAAYPGDQFAVSVIFWDGDGQGREARLALVGALENAAIDAGANLKASRIFFSFCFQSEARDPETPGLRLLALSALFSEDVRANPASALAALIDPAAWRGVLEAA